MLGWMKSQAGTKTARRNINNLRHADDTTLMAESEEEIKSLLMRVRKNKKAGLKINILKTKIIASRPITSRQIEEEKSGNSDRFYLLGLQNHCG